MPAGPGKYDDVCTQVREDAQAQGVIVLIENGVKGSGFSVQGDAVFIARLAERLDFMAAEIRRSMGQGQD